MLNQKLSGTHPSLHPIIDIKSHPSNKLLMDSEGICFACDIPVSIGLEKEIKKNYEHACPKTYHLCRNECVLNT